MAVTIREPEPSDSSRIADLHVATWKEAYSHLLPADFFSAHHVEGRHRMWNHVLTHPQDDMTVQIAEADGAIVGFSWAGPAEALDGEKPPRPLTLYAIYVLAAHHGQGVGQQLLDAAIGTRPAMLWVAKENERATNFYLRNGFGFDGVEQIDPHAPLITDARMVR